MYAHRGIHYSGTEENTLSSFTKALHDMDGFECDVRLSHDRVPVVIHDATLRRTHGISIKVNLLSAEKLQSLDIPTAYEVLSLKGLKGKCIILDLKEHERILCDMLSESIDNCEADVILLSWSDRRPTVMHTVYKAVDYRFTVPSTFDGISCKFNGSSINLGSINRALNSGVPVNLFAPNSKDSLKMIMIYGKSCSYTIK